MPRIDYCAVPLAIHRKGRRNVSQLLQHGTQLVRCPFRCPAPMSLTFTGLMAGAHSASEADIFCVHSAGPMTRRAAVHRAPHLGGGITRLRLGPVFPLQSKDRDDAHDFAGAPSVAPRARQCEGRGEARGGGGWQARGRHREARHHGGGAAAGRRHQPHRLRDAGAGTPRQLLNP